MTVEEAIHIIRPGVQSIPGVWADIGAGTGMFTKALAEIMNRRNGGNGGNGKSRIYAVDKSPHALWQLKSSEEVEIIVVDADFNYPLDLPPLDGIIMANALHYATDHLHVIKNVTRSLKINGTFILLEYDTQTARPPWVPYPVSFDMFESLCKEAGFSPPVVIGSLASIYGHDRIYAATTSMVSR